MMMSEYIQIKKGFELTKYLNIYTQQLMTNALLIKFKNLSIYMSW